MFYRINDRFKRMKYDFQCRKIFKTPPLRIKQAPLKILSMVSHRDLTMYLVAIKSLYNHIREGGIVAINDGSLTKNDIDILSKHLGAPEILHLQEIQTGVCPKGGCWERLLTVIDLTADQYVIQLDSDTLARSEVREVVNSYRANHSFILGTKSGQTISLLSEAPNKIRHVTSDFVQIIAERNFDRMKNSQNFYYVRGSAGFAGFARGVFSRKQVEEFSVEMSELIGIKKWSEWGSEQVTSNYILANSPDVTVLPCLQYTAFYPDVEVDNAVFLHFIGTYRFDRDIYAQESVRIIKELGKGAYKD